MIYLLPRNRLIKLPQIDLTIMKSSKIFKSFIILILITLNFGCDQVSKSVVRKNIAEFDHIEVIGNHLTLTKVENQGAALGFASSFHPTVKFVVIIILPSLLLFILFCSILYKKDIDKYTIIGLAFIIGGGIGNLFDRVFYGSVTDFVILDFGIFKTGIFNMADLSVTIGAVIIGIHSLLSLKKSSAIE